MNAAPGMRTTILPNGLTVIEAPILAAQMVGITVIVPVGINDGTPAEAGALALLAETFFRGTALTVEQDAILERFEDLGARYSTDLERDWLTIEVQAPAESGFELVKLLGELITQPAFVARQLAQGRALLLEQIKGVEQDPEEWLECHWLSSVWTAASGQSRPPWGDDQGIRTATPARVADMHRRVFDPSKMAIMISGGAAIGSADIAREFGGMVTPTGRPPLRRAGAPELRTDTASHGLIRPTGVGEMDQVTMHVAVPLRSVIDSVGRVDQRAMAAARLLAGVLSAGMSARLFYELSEQRGLCYSVEGGFDYSRHSTIFQLITSTSPANAEQTLTLAFDQLRAIATGDPARGGITDAELRKARKQIAYWVASTNGTAARIATGTAIRWARGETLRDADAMIRDLDKITVGEVTAWARSIVAGLDNARIAFVAPTDMGPALTRAVHGRALPGQGVA